MGECAARQAAAHQCDRQHHFCGGIGLVCRHLRHHRQDDHPRAATQGLPYGQGDWLAGRCGHAGAADSAVHHHDRLRRGGRGLHCQAVCGGCATGADAGHAVQRFSGHMGADEPRPDSRGRCRHDIRPEAERIAPPHTRGGAHCSRHRLHLHRCGHSHRGRRHWRGGCAGAVSATGLAEPQNFHRCVDGRNTPVLHDCADSGGSSVSHAVHGLHRAAEAPGRVCRRLGPEPRHAAGGPGGFLHIVGLFSGRHFHGRVDHGRDFAHRDRGGH